MKDMQELPPALFHVLFFSILSKENAEIGMNYYKYNIAIIYYSQGVGLK